MSCPAETRRWKSNRGLLPVVMSYNFCRFFNRIHCWAQLATPVKTVAAATQLLPAQSGRSWQHPSRPLPRRPSYCRHSRGAVASARPGEVGRTVKLASPDTTRKNLLAPKLAKTLAQSLRPSTAGKNFQRPGCCRHNQERSSRGGGCGNGSVVAGTVGVQLATPGEVERVVKPALVRRSL